MPRIINHFVALLFVFSIFIVVDSCLTRFCGKNKSLPIHYPFRLEGDNKHQKGCDQIQAVNLKCNNHENIPVLNLNPSIGDLYIRNINYSSQIIRRYDPKNCLPAMFMNNSNFSISPLMAISYQNYTFYNCPLTSTTRSNFNAIGCLSNATYYISATSSISRAQEMNSLGCDTIRTVQIPVSSPLQYEYNGFRGDLVLTWDVHDCEVCENTAKHKHAYNAGVTVAVALSPLLFRMVIKPLVRAVQKYRGFVKWHLSGLASRASEWSAHWAQDDPITRQMGLPVVAARPRRVELL